MFRRRRRRHHSSRPDPNRNRNLVFGGGVIAVLAIAASLPLLLSPAPPPAQSAAPTSGGLPAPGVDDLPSLIPVAELPTPAPGQPTFPPVHVPSFIPVPPPATAGPGVPADRIRIPSLSIDLPIVEGDGVDVPMGKAAHYPGSAWPGGGTNIYLYGHAREGMFLNLWSARVGDRVFMDLDDGSTREYVVDEVLPTVAWNQVELLDPTPTEQLTLQTCVTTSVTGPRFVVIAKPVGVA